VAVGVADFKIDILIVRTITVVVMNRKFDWNGWMPAMTERHIERSG